MVFKVQEAPTAGTPELKLKLKLKPGILTQRVLQGRNLTSRALQSSEVAVDRQEPVPASSRQRVKDRAEGRVIVFAKSRRLKLRDNILRTLWGSFN